MTFEHAFVVRHILAGGIVFQSEDDAYAYAKAMDFNGEWTVEPVLFLPEYVPAGGERTLEEFCDKWSRDMWNRHEDEDDGE